MSNRANSPAAATVATAFLLHAMLTLIPGLAHADTGTLRGVIRADDLRVPAFGASGTTTNVCMQTGLIATHACAEFTDDKPVPHVRVTLAVAGSDKFTTISDQNGRYELWWDSPYHPTTATLQVWWVRPDMPAGTTTTSSPRNVFRITAGTSNAIIVNSMQVTLNGGDETQTFATTGNGEVVSAFRTTDEVYERVISQSSVLFSDMRDVIIHTTYPAPLPGGINYGAVAPNDKNVYLSTAMATLRPWVVAHEIGHLISWSSLQLTVAPMLSGLGAPGSYAACDGVADPAWTTFSQECEQPAHWEGWANFVEAAWAWAPTAPAPVAIRNDANVNVPVETPGPGNPCSPGSTTGHRRAQCHAMAFWDMYDSVNDGDDNVSLNIQSLRTHMRSYPDNCQWPADNRCSNEGATGIVDFHAINHMDWTGNWQGPEQTTISKIFKQNGVVFGNNQ